MAKKFPVKLAKIPCSVAWGFSMEHTEIASVFGFKNSQTADFGKIPRKIPCYRVSSQTNAPHVLIQADRRPL